MADASPATPASAAADAGESARAEAEIAALAADESLAALAADAAQISPGDALLAKALRRLGLCKLIARSAAGVRQAAVHHTHALLDITYVLELALVEGGFADAAATGRVAASLATVEPRAARLAAAWGGAAGAAAGAGGAAAAPMQEWLGRELAEVVQWRRGAFSYMRAGTAMRGAADDGGAAAALAAAGVGRGSVEEGLAQLGAMLDSAAASGEAATVGSDDAATVAMVAAGALSDVHMLAFMYAGELGCWAWHAYEAGVPSAQSELAAASAQRLRQLLGVLKVMAESDSALNQDCARSWDTSRAREILAVYDDR